MRRRATDVHLEPGLYELTIDASGLDVGDYNFTLIDLADFAPINVNTTFAGAASARLQSGQRFEAVAGTRYYVDLTNTETPDLPVRYRLLDSNGRSVFDNIRSANQLFTAEITGSYTLIVDSGYSTIETLNYSGIVSVVPSPANIDIVVGESVSGSIALAGDYRIYNLSISDDTPLYFDTILNKLGNSEFVWTLEGPAGVLVSRERFGASASAELLAKLDVPASDYRIVVESLGNSFSPPPTGDFQFQLLDLSDGMPISLNEEISVSLDAGYDGLFNVEVAVGDTLRLHAIDAQVSFAKWKLISPRGEVISDTSFSDIPDIQIETSGIYRLLIENPLGSNISSDFTFSVELQSSDPPLPFSGSSLILGQSVSGTLTPDQNQTRFLFSLTQPSDLYFDALSTASDIAWRVDGPTGKVAMFNAFTTPHLEALANLPSGDYQLTLNTTSASDREYAFNLIDLSTIAKSNTNELLNRISVGNQAQVFRFDASSGDRIFYNNISSSLQFYHLQILDPDGRLITPALAQSVLFEHQVLEARYDGVYTAVLQRYSGDLSDVPYQARWENLGPVRTSSFNIGELATGSIRAPGDIQEHTFSLSQTSQLYLDNRSGFDQLTWELRNEYRQMIAQTSFTSAESSNGFQQLRLPEGNYTLSIGSTFRQTGEYAFALTDVSTAQSISTNAEISASHSAFATDLYQFEAEVGDRLFFDVTSNTASLDRWRLFDPFGQPVFDEFVNDVRIFDASSSGVYTLAIRGTGSGAVDGNYSFRIEEVAPVAVSTLVLGSIQTGSIDVPGNIDIYEFELAERTLVYFDGISTLANGSKFSWQLDGPSGSDVGPTNFARFANVQREQASLARDPTR